MEQAATELGPFEVEPACPRMIRSSVMIGYALAIAVVIAGCGGRQTSERPPPGAAERLGAPSGRSRVIYCTPSAADAKVRAHLPAGSGLRELVVWYIAVTCRTVVVVSEELLARTSPNSVDAMVAGDRVDAVFRSRLGELGLRATELGDHRLVVVSPAADTAVFTGVEERK